MRCRAVRISWIVVRHKLWTFVTHYAVVGVSHPQGYIKVTMRDVYAHLVIKTLYIYVKKKIKIK